MPIRPLSRSLRCTLGAATALTLVATGAHAAPQFARVFTDHAVVQRDQPVRVWGTAAASQTVTVSLNGQQVTATADAAGKWSATLPAMPAGRSYALSASDATGTTTLSDIAIGDVFLCSGQSNMEFQVKYATNAWGETYNSANSDIRFVTIARDSQTAPLAELSTPVHWQVASPDTIGEASAVCYYMVKDLQARYKVPVGMIHSSWGGTVAQAWISEPGLKSLKRYDDSLAALKTYATTPDAAKAAWAKRMYDSWRASETDPDLKAQWIKPGFDDSAWKTMTPKGTWEASGDPELAAFDGILWYRQTITLTAAEAKAARTISLGAVDDADITWVNGTYVGSISGWDTPRDYALPRGVLKAGKNVIVVRATDTGGGGGFSAGPEARKLTLADGTTKALPAQWRYKISGPIVPDAPQTGEPWAVPNGLTNLYNAMIAPLAPYTLKGVAWYQGESNTYSPAEYASLLPALMADWRRSFQSPDLPFLIVQLANYGPVTTKPGRSGWAELRQVQHTTVRNDARAGLAVSIDFGDRSDIHPTQKTIVGNRLARNARAVIYGEAVTPGGPEAVAVKRSGDDLVVSFKDTNGGLVTYSSDTAIGFETCTAPDACRYAIATISGDTVVLRGAAQPGVTTVRYAWAESPYVNLYSADDLPAVPFTLEISQ